ncbi:hypothetical protein DDB_G0267354 [Dictyostelium discoideum AX4]|uniref:Uncharacterized protein n=1 Tax=Dictyostelium discoideum TaxID=44689 RepID=Q55GY0_DICDI|nr:hypothetical protein DDB_G0267354 [Dictyostelium discoideum AX4]EAL73766.1 hypothetical protein DDB_G0267354 [Dictyostelium discoideum AX4]|eukprot:XP_647690.1 hypothetical protein DDB_G0267354 [Dictyostelium discoideum AX4]
MNSSANFIAPNGNVPDFNQSPIQRRTNNNISIGDESFNNLSIGNVLGNANVPNPMENQRIIIRRVSNFFITGIIKQAGGSNEDCTSQNIFARLTKWVSNKESNTRTKVADSLAIYSKGEKNHNLKVYISDSQFSPALLSLFLSHINYENYQNDIFIKEFVDSCKTGEEKHWYPDSVPLIKRLISILNDFSSKFDSKAKMRKDAQEAFQFPHSALYLNSSQ